MKRKERKKERKGKSSMGYISAITGSRSPMDRFSQKWHDCIAIDVVLIQANFGFNIFTAFRYTESQIFHVPVDFGGPSLQQCCSYRSACDWNKTRDLLTDCTVYGRQ